MASKKDKDDKGGNGQAAAAAASASTAAPSAAPQGTPPAATTRKRSALSAEKTMAIVIAGLVAILTRAEVAAVTTDEEKTKVDAANKIASDLNAQTIDPLKKRITEIQAEFKAILAKMAEPGADVTTLADQSKKLSQELSQKQKQLESYTKLAAA